MLYLLAAHVVMALAAPVLVAWWGRRAFLVLALAPASAAVWALAQTRAVLDGAGPVEVVEWVPGLSLELAFRMDTLTWLMVLLVGGVGALVLVYCSAYFSKSAGGLGRFGGVLVAFAGAMLGLVASDDLLMLYVFWELTTVFSYLLIGHYADRKASRRAAMQAIIITTAGGLAMLVGLVLLGHAAGTYRLSEVIADPPGGTVATVAVVCLLAGAVTKSALLPFHFWLPAAMAAPTPVSAYLHAAAMVKAGVYLVARFAPAYADLTAWRVIVLTLGCGTLLLGGYRAMRQYDLKLVLAFGTVSQLGLIVLLVGYGTQATALAGVALVGAHAMFKAALFLVVGVVDAAAGTRDLRRLSGVGRALPVTATVGVLAAASMVGLPPFAGYVAKEAALEAVLHDDDGGWVAIVVLAAVAVGSALTVAYGLRFVWGAFASKPQPPVAPAGTDAAAEQPTGFASISQPSFVMTVPALVLAVLGLVLALVPTVGEEVLSPYASTLPRGEAGHLVLWAGLTPVLLITIGVLVVGTALFVARTRVERVQVALHVDVDADRAYRRTMRKLDDFAADVTAQTQRGSLPFYLGAILIVLVALTGTALVTGTRLPDAVLWGDSVLQVIIAVLILGAAVLAARSRRRLKAVVLLGACGYGIAVLFLLHGAPDLALTQVLVETITLVVFVLVLRRLPPYFSDRPLARSRWLRLAIALAVGSAVGALALIAPGARQHLPQSVPFPEEAYSFGGGKNIVNVVLVDIRAWDTMGEIAVLLVAATGVASLIFLQRRSGELHRLGDVDERTAARVWGGGLDAGARLRRPAVALTTDAPLPSSPIDAGSVGMASRRARSWLRAEQTLAPQRRSVIFEVVTRLLFHTMVVVALFLLFSGHNSPGGGFAAGLIVGVALIVRYLAGGRYELGEAAPVHPGLLLGSGLFLSAGVGLVALLAGGEVLQSVIIDLEVPVLGTIHLVTSLFFDIGVFLVVVGLVLDVLRSLGAEIDRHGEEDGADAAGSEHGVEAHLPSEPGESDAPSGTRAGSAVDDKRGSGGARDTPGPRGTRHTEEVTR
ncbi:Na+/H+ antiporter subunit A [Cellulomonas sp. ATA003]|uniref:Na+/H+ antiporter subunit A n=1 Tax=Cellulomonas sp. ATA003 TaxID=3073064 RepID=UPI002873E275|nr:Na+/H+ antiporter subunit A [Cellulomonas sp. ATA003]WNB85743.1 Na+/H+ antiporter subunit A [Cellulomonas sp. ATA003]